MANTKFIKFKQSQNDNCITCGISKEGYTRMCKDYAKELDLCCLECFKKWSNKNG